MIFIKGFLQDSEHPEYAGVMENQQEEYGLEFFFQYFPAVIPNDIILMNNLTLDEPRKMDG